MSLWTSLFGGDVLKKATDGLYHGVDKAIYTQEEQAQGFIDLLKAYEPFKLAQRFIALMVTGSYLLVWLMAAVLLVVSAFIDPATGKQMEESARVLAELNNDTLGIPAALVLSFYYAGGALEGVVSRLKAKK